MTVRVGSRLTHSWEQEVVLNNYLSPIDCIFKLCLKKSESLYQITLESDDIKQDERNSGW